MVTDGRWETISVQWKSADYESQSRNVQIVNPPSLMIAEAAAVCQERLAA